MIVCFRLRNDVLLQNYIFRQKSHEHFTSEWKSLISCWDNLFVYTKCHEIYFSSRMEQYSFWLFSYMNLTQVLSLISWRSTSWHSSSSIYFSMETIIPWIKNELRVFWTFLRILLLQFYKIFVVWKDVIHKYKMKMTGKYGAVSKHFPLRQYSSLRKSTVLKIYFIMVNPIFTTLMCDGLELILFTLYSNF